MIRKNLITEKNKLSFSFFDYGSTKPNVFKELMRYDILEKLRNNVSNLHADLIDAYSQNKNSDDPVICLTKSMNQTAKRIVSNGIKEIKAIKEYQNIVHVTKEIEGKYYRLCCSVDETHEIKVDRRLYRRIKKQCIVTDLEYDFDELLWCLFFRYKIIGLLNGLSGALPSKSYKALQNKYGCNIECFGSFFNHTLKYYFGLFYDLEQWFGCLGNFFNSHFDVGFYVMNPPYILSIMNLAMQHFCSHLDKASISVLIVLPAWDLQDRRILNLRCKGKKLGIDYDDKFMGRTLLIDYEKYCKGYYLYCKSRFPYFNYLTQQTTYFAPTNIIIMSSVLPDFECNGIIPPPTVSINSINHCNRPFLTIKHSSFR
jgi:hypothetical protein